MKANEATKTQLSGKGRTLRSPVFGKWPKTSTLGQRISVIPQFRNFEKNNLWRVGYESQRSHESAAEWGGKARKIANFWRWPHTHTLGQHIFVIPQFRNSEKNNLWRVGYESQRSHGNSAEWEGKAPSFVDSRELADNPNFGSTHFRYFINPKKIFCGASAMKVNEATETQLSGAGRPVIQPILGNGQRPVPWVNTFS